MNWEKLLAENFANAVPKGYETTRQIAERWNCRIETANQRLNRLFEKGLVDRLLFHVLPDFEQHAMQIS